MDNSQVPERCPKHNYEFKCVSLHERCLWVCEACPPIEHDVGDTVYHKGSGKRAVVKRLIGSCVSHSPADHLANALSKRYMCDGEKRWTGRYVIETGFDEELAVGHSLITDTKPDEGTDDS